MNTHVDNVLERYSEGAKERQATLCCPVSYDPGLLALLPQEIIEKDYGCGDPSRYVRAGDVVLDLGSGGGKVCYMAAQVAGPGGRVLGVDMNDDMLALARKYQSDMAAQPGMASVQFLKGRIEDLALDVEAMERQLAGDPVSSATEFAAFTAWQETQRRDRPLIADGSVDVVISNCVLNLVDDARKPQLVREIFRVLKPGGRLAISDIVSDEFVPENMKSDAELWTGCISGAFQEQEFINAFVEAGFLAVQYDKWDAAPWQVVDGIEFRSVTLTAVKGAGTACLDYGHAVIYRGPYASVTDDEGHIYLRGERMAVCERTYRLLTAEGPYREHFIGIAPQLASEPVPWCAPVGTRRPVAATKEGRHTQPSAQACC